MVHTSTSSSFVQDAASVAASRFQEVVTHMQKPETRSQIQAKVDYIVKTLFAPCVGGVGGVPFEEMGEDGKKYYPDGIPMEVTPNTSEESMNAPRAKQQQPFTFGPAYPESNKIGRQENSLQKLRKLGARHQLAQGYIDPTLPDVARPVSPEEKYAVPCTDIGNEVIDDEVDFDDGISAISSHTLEEMEKKRNALTVRVNPTEFSKKDFSKKPIMEAMSGETEDDDFFGEPFFNQPTKLERVELSNVTSDSKQLEKAWNVDEANYWKDEVSKDNDKRSSRQKQRLSVEERAKRLRELSRSRSRSSGTGSVSSFRY
jgi:hypothetical protein